MDFVLETVSAGKILIFVPPKKGITVYSNFLVKRERPKEEIGEAEMKNAVGQAVWKKFDEYRNLLSYRLGIPETEVVLIDSRVSGVKIDGAKVLNPLGFPASTIEILIAETFVSRDFLKSAEKEIAGKGEVVMAIEGNTLLAKKTGMNSGLKSAVFAKCEKEDTYVYSIKSDGEVILISDFNWGTDNLSEAIAERFSLPFDVAMGVADKYIQGETSLDFLKKFRPHLEKAIDPLIKGVASAAHNAKIIKPSVFLAIPGLSASPKVFRFGDNQMKVAFVSEGDQRSAALAELTASSGNDDFSKFAKQRIKWLLPSNISL